MAVPNAEKRPFTDVAMTHPCKLGIPNRGILWNGQMRRRTGDFSF